MFLNCCLINTLKRQVFTIKTLNNNTILQLTVVRKSESAATSGSNIKQNEIVWTRLKNMVNTIKVP